MCYNVKVTSAKEEEEKRFNALLDQAQESFPGYEIVSGFEHPHLPVITSEDTGHITLMEWGLVPSWIKSEHAAMEIQNQTLNARAESLFDKPSFRSIVKKRCLVLVDGFYEWMHEARKKVPHFIHLKEPGPFALGGLYDEWVNTETGEIFKGFSIITLAANPLMAAIHNTKKRMPLILHREDEQRWIDPALDKTGIKALLVQYPESQMKAEVYTKNNPPENPGGLFYGNEDALFTS